MILYRLDVELAIEDGFAIAVDPGLHRRRVFEFPLHIKIPGQIVGETFGSSLFCVETGANRIQIASESKESVGFMKKRTKPAVDGWVPEGESKGVIHDSPNCLI